MLYRVWSQSRSKSKWKYLDNNIWVTEWADDRYLMLKVTCPVLSCCWCEQTVISRSCCVCSFDKAEQNQPPVGETAKTSHTEKTNSEWLFSKCQSFIMIYYETVWHIGPGAPLDYHNDKPPTAHSSKSWGTSHGQNLSSPEWYHTICPSTAAVGGP